jgi:hypothetical protein
MAKEGLAGSVAASDVVKSSNAGWDHSRFDHGVRRLTQNEAGL